MIHRRIFLISALLLGYLNSVYGQNLIPNPGFEDILACPDHSGQLSNAIPWMNPNLKSPDIYHRCVGQDCTNLPFVCIPNNWVGHQWPYTGDAYAGLFVGGGNPNREYMQVALENRLEAGQAYVLTYYLSLADTYDHAIDRMGVYFSNESVAVEKPIAFTPQSTSPPGVFLDEKEDWMEIRDTFIASGGEGFLTIGNFNDETRVRFITGLGGERASAYYYLDDFSLRPLPTTPPKSQEEESKEEEEKEQTPDNSTSPCDFFIPNAFSPNGDGINDTFSTLGDCDAADFELLVFNRWGGSVFSSFSPYETWDGSVRQRPAPPGIYAYLLRYTIAGREVIKKGKIILLR